MRNSKKIHVKFVKLSVFTSNYQTWRKFMFFGCHFTKIRIKDWSFLLIIYFKRSLKFGSFPLSVRYLNIFARLRSLVIAVRKEKRYASNNFLIVSWRPNSFMTTLLYCTKKNLLSFIYGIATVFPPIKRTRTLYMGKKNDGNEWRKRKLSRIF